MEYLEKDKNITELSNFKTPAKAAYFFELACEHDVQKLSEIDNFCRQKNIPLLLVGWGTNMLFAFNTYPGVVVKNKLRGWEYNKQTKILETHSDEKIRHIALILEMEDGQALWHRFIGLPGTIGGAIYGNAGCFWLEIESNFLSAKVFNRQTWKIEELCKEQMQFEYRSSCIKKEGGKYYIISAKFDLSQKKEKYASDVDNIYFREHKQPKGNSCGSFFKNPIWIIVQENGQEKVITEHAQIVNKKETSNTWKNLSAGYLIEQVGLKGHHSGGAYFSELHANFLMHDGTGNYTDLLTLISLAQWKVKENFGIDMENEVQIIDIK